MKLLLSFLYLTVTKLMDFDSKFGNKIATYRLVL